jgi:thermitase
MKILFRSFVLAALVATVMTIMPGRAFSAPLAPGGAAAYVPGEVLVKYTPSSTLQERKASIAAQGNTFMADLNMGGWTRVRTAAGQTVDDAIAAYQGDPNVESVQPNYIYHITAVPNVSQYGQLWAYKNTQQTIDSSYTQPPGTPLSYTTNNPGTAGDDMNIEKAWDLITDCSGTAAVVAVVDTGVNYKQQDLASSLWTSGTDTFSINHGYNFVDNNNDPMDKHGHGTHVAGIIGASGDSTPPSGGTTSGVCWKASIMAVRVLDASGTGDTVTITQGVNFAVAHGAKVINMSLGGGGSIDSLFNTAITDAQTADVVVVVAAGNSASNNDTTPTYPCNFTQTSLICVAALDQSYALSTFSNYGAKSVDVGAPGTNILSTWAGTSGVLPVDLTTGWTFSSTTTPTGGWAPSTFTVNNVSTPFLVDPSNYPSGTYNRSTDDRVYKDFNLTGFDAAVVDFGAAVDIIAGDDFRVGCKSSGGDPFSGGIKVLDITNEATYPNLIELGADISSCISANCGLGFQLQSGSVTPKRRGVGLTFLGTFLGIDTLMLNNSSYNTINGTSMATPEVAGLATMLRAYNPQFTAMDVVNAIKNGGRPTPSLTGKTSTGRAVDVMSSLVYINPPTGLSYTVQ